MKKTVLKTKGYFDGKDFKVTHIKLTKAICGHEKNKHLNLSPDYFSFSDDTETLPGTGNGCPADTTAGYYVKVSGNCVFVPYG